MISNASQNKKRRDGLRLCAGLSLMIALANQGSTHARANADDEPYFRARTDANAVEDLKKLREELNLASDANGAINPLGKFLERSNKTKEPARLEIGASDSENNSNRDLDPAASKPKPRREILTLPGPRLTIIQQASPEVRRSVDGFRPARTVADIDATIRPSLQYPVTLASANLPIVGQPNSYIARYQGGPEIPSGANLGTGLPSGFPTQPGFNTNVQPVLPPSPMAIPNNVGAAPPVVAGPPVFSTPIQDTQPMTNNPGPYNIPPPTYPQPIYNPNGPLNSNQGFPGGMASPSDSVRPMNSPYVNGAPFVSNAPRQFDARNMVACNAYRQSVDPCAQPCRSNPNEYASAPYATGGSPFAYVPPTYMPSGKSSGYRPLIGFGQNSYDPFLGRGIVGQPVAYVDGQPVRNFIRYIFP